MSNPNYDGSPQISLRDQQVLQRRFEDVRPSLEVQIGSYPGASMDDIGSVESSRIARFQFDEGTVVVAIAEAFGSEFFNSECKVVHFGGPRQNKHGEKVRTIEEFVVSKHEIYGADNEAEVEVYEDGGDAQPEYRYSKKTQRWVKPEAGGTGSWSEPVIANELKSIDDDGLLVYDFTLGPDEFLTAMSILDRTFKSKIIPL